jgi:RNA polymerase sigma-70 factor (ECF subfamily)
MADIQRVDDEYILACIGNQDRSEEGYRLLIRKYQQKLYWHIRRMVGDHEDADDVLQNVFVKVFKNIGGFQSNSSLFTWMYRIATNESLTFLEKKKRSKAVEINDSTTSVLQAGPLLDEQKASQLLSSAIDALPLKQKEVFCLRYYDELSYQDISSITDTSVGGLKASFHHAVKKIEEYINLHI